MYRSLFPQPSMLGNFQTTNWSIVEGSFSAVLAEKLWVKRSVVLNHVKSSKHEEGKKKLKTKQAREVDLALTLDKHDHENNRKGRRYLMLRKSTELE